MIPKPRVTLRTWHKALRAARLISRAARRARFLPRRQHPAAPLAGETKAETQARRNAAKRARRSQ